MKLIKNDSIIRGKTLQRVRNVIISGMHLAGLKFWMVQIFQARTFYTKNLIYQTFQDNCLSFILLQTSVICPVEFNDKIQVLSHFILEMQKHESRVAVSYLPVWLSWLSLAIIGIIMKSMFLTLRILCTYQRLTEGSI